MPLSHSFRLVYKPRNSYFLLISTIIWFQFHCNEWHVSFSLLWMTYLDECHVSIRMPVPPWTLEDDVLDLSRKMCSFLYMIVVWCVATVGPTCRCPIMLWDTPRSPQRPHLQGWSSASPARVQHGTPILMQQQPATCGCPSGKCLPCLFVGTSRTCSNRCHGWARHERAQTQIDVHIELESQFFM